MTLLAPKKYSSKQSKRSPFSQINDQSTATPTELTVIAISAKTATILTLTISATTTLTMPATTILAITVASISIITI